MGNKSRSNINQINQVLRNKSQAQKNSSKSIRYTILLLNFLPYIIATLCLDICKKQKKILAKKSYARH